MSNAYAQLIPDARSFLKQLNVNNTRDWFQAHKAQYDADLKRPAELLLDHIAVDLGQQTGQVIKSKLFRPHRDVRFSKDKTPYHTHLHLLWTAPDFGRQPMGWFFGLGLDYISIGAGLMGFEKDTLTTWRKHVDGAAGDDLSDLLSDLAAQGFRIAEPELKRVPAPYDKDHPNAALLRRKSLSAWRDVQADAPPNLPKDMLQIFKDLSPLTEAMKAVL